MTPVVSSKRDIYTSYDLSPRCRDHYVRGRRKILTWRGPKWIGSSGHGRTIVVISSTVVVCTKVAESGEQLTADGFWKIRVSFL